MSEVDDSAAPASTDNAQLEGAEIKAKLSTEIHAIISEENPLADAAKTWPADGVERYKDLGALEAAIIKLMLAEDATLFDMEVVIAGLIRKRDSQKVGFPYE